MAAVVFHIVFTFAAPGRNLALFFCRKQNQTERHHAMRCDETFDHGQ